MNKTKRLTANVFFSIALFLLFNSANPTRAQARQTIEPRSSLLRNHIFFNLAMRWDGAPCNEETLSHVIAKENYFNCCLSFHRYMRSVVIDYAICVWFRAGGVAPPRSIAFRTIALVRLSLGLFPFLLTLSIIYSTPLLFFLLLHSDCSHAQCTLCQVHTSCMGSPFPTIMPLLHFKNGNTCDITFLSCVHCRAERTIPALLLILNSCTVNKGKG